jgi:hypothetical protein
VKSATALQQSARAPGLEVRRLRRQVRDGRVPPASPQNELRQDLRVRNVPAILRRRRKPYGK